MKKVKLVFILLLLPFILLKGQNTDRPDYKNSVQFNPLSTLIFRNYTIQYERGIGNSFSLSLALGVKSPGSIFRINGFDSPRMKTNDFEFTGYNIFTEYRWYFQKTTRKRTGLYLGMYYKFKNIGQNIDGSYTSSKTKETYPIDIDINLSTNYFGVMFGYKFMFSKHFYMDILIAGPGYSVTKMKIEEEKPMPSQFYIDIASEIANRFGIVSNFLDDIEVKEVSARSASSTLTLPAFRYGFRIGYSF